MSARKCFWSAGELIAPEEIFLPLTSYGCVLIWIVGRVPVETKQSPCPFRISIGSVRLLCGFEQALGETLFAAAAQYSHSAEHSTSLFMCDKFLHLSRSSQLVIIISHCIAALSLVAVVVVATSASGAILLVPLAAAAAAAPAAAAGRQPTSVSV